MKTHLKRVLTTVLVVTILLIIYKIITPLYKVPSPFVASYSYKTSRDIPLDKLKNELEETITSFSQNHYLNGTVLVAQDDKIVYQKNFGFADQADGTRINTDTQYLIGSITKHLTAAALLKALLDKYPQEEKHSIETYIKEVLNKSLAYYLPPEHAIWLGSMPEWANNVTLYHLLTHTSGIANFTSLPNIELLAIIAPKAPKLVSFFKNEPTEFEPGERYSYSNSNYVLLGQVVEAITEKPLDIYMAQSFFEPLGMNSTFLATSNTAMRIKKDDARARRLARGYNFDAYAEHPILTEPKHYAPMELPLGSGGLVSTAPDLLKWNNALYAGKVIPEALVKLMVTPYVAMDKENKKFYGYGITIHKHEALGDIYYHEGSIPGFRSKLTYIPSQSISVICMTNAVEAWEKLLPELGELQEELPKDLAEEEKNEQSKKIISERHPNFARTHSKNNFIALEKAIVDVVSKVYEKVHP